MSEVLMPALMLGGAGGVIGLILAIVANVFEVKGEQLTEDIKSALPGLNCGVCGYAGCGDYARALSVGEESDYTLCIPGKEVAKTKVQELLAEEGLI